MEYNGKKIDAKFVFWKIIFFLALVIFMAVFSAVFGSDNTLVGVMVIVAALMMLGKDMSVRPFSSLAGLLIINLSLGLGAYATTFNPWLGLIINFAVIFTLTYVMMHDLKMPFWFPFILGYAFILSMPVGISALPLRLESLAVGAVFIVGLNLLVNRGREKKTCHAGITALLNSTISVIDKKNAGEELDLGSINAATQTTVSAMYDRVKDRYFISTDSKSVLNLAIALEELGQAVVEKEHSQKDLEDLKALIEKMAAHESGELDLETLRTEMGSFLDSHRNMHSRVLRSLRITEFELEIMAEGPKNEGKEYETGEISRGLRMKTFLKENLNKNSLKFTFSFRLALMMSFWWFIGDYFDIENARWLMFTSIAIVAPYIEGSSKKSLDRLAGTAVGLTVFILMMPFLNDAALISVIMLAIGFIYTLLDPMKYPMQMAFNTVSAMLMALTLFPGSPIVWGRIAFIAIGVGAAFLANRIILPYHIHDETVDLTEKSMSAARGQLRDLRDTVEGKGNSSTNAALLVNSFAVSGKIRMNNDQEPDPDVSKFLSVQNEVILNSAFMKRGIALSGLADRDKEDVLALLDRYGPDGGKQIPDTVHADGSDAYNDTVDILKYYRKCCELSGKIRNA